jgi:hypothetical protein
LRWFIFIAGNDEFFVIDHHRITGSQLSAAACFDDAVDQYGA